MSGLRAAVGMFTVLPAGRPQQDAHAASRAVLWMPLVGAVVAALATLPALLVWHGAGHGSTLVAATVIVTMQLLLTRGLHIDGLADLADGLGSRRPSSEALDIMRRSDIGPFGVAALVAVLLLQTSSLAAVLGGHRLPLALLLVLVPAATARLAVVWSARRGVPAARPDGFGALVSGSLGARSVLATTAGVVGAAVLGAVLTGASAQQIGWLLGSMLVGLAGAVLLCAHAVRRLGGVTGDVFGALVEVTSTLVLIVLAAQVAWR